MLDKFQPKPPSCESTEKNTSKLSSVARDRHLLRQQHLSTALNRTLATSENIRNGCLTVSPPTVVVIGNGSIVKRT